MASSTPYVATRFTLTATIGNVVFEDIVSISANFALNAIPSATLVVASGKDYINNKIATIHKEREYLQHRAPVEVLLKIENTDGQKDMMEEGTYVIFRGVLAGIGYQRAYDSVSYTLHILHWLDELNNSCIMNGNWFPGAPQDMAQSAGSYSLELERPTWSTVPTIDINREIINEQNMAEDLWGKVFQPIYKRFAEFLPPRYQGQAGQKNDAAIAALNRMPPDDTVGKAYYTPLKLDLENIDGFNLSFAVREQIVADAKQSYSYTTFWSKLIGDYAPQYFFAISPAVEYALPIPFFAGLKQHYVPPHHKAAKRDVTIDSDEYNYANFNANMSQIVESVDVFYSAQSGSGLMTGGFDPGGVSFKFPLGWYPPEAAQQQTQRGLKLLKEPPGWMTNIVPWSAFAATCAGLRGSTCPGGTDVPQNGPDQVPDGFTVPEQIVADAQQGSPIENKAMTRFAHHWYKTEVLYQRHGELSGKLRFDIAPGTIVKINTPPYDMDSQAYDSLFATATQVAFVINAEKATAGTSFVLSHIRTETENNNQSLFTFSRPPLYKTGWLGGPLAVKK